MNKALFIFPPISSYYRPHLAMPLISSQLQKIKFPYEVIDLNIDFFNKIYSAKYINECIEELYKNTNKNEIKEFIDKNQKRIKKISNAIEKAKLIMKNKKHFFCKSKLLYAKSIFSFCDEIIKLTKNNIFSNNNIEKLELSEIISLVTNKDRNPFYNYFYKKLNEIKNKNSNIIFLSIQSEIQLLAGLTLAYLVKRETNTSICLGGNFFNRISDKLTSMPEFFNYFADFIMVGDGEISIIPLVKFIDNKTKIENIPNLIYIKENKIIKNKILKSKSFNEIEFPDYSHINFEEYFSPINVLPLQINKGCYWNKCTFCNMSYGKNLIIKKVSNIINEIKHNKEKYGITTYNIVGESLIPDVLDELSTQLINENLEIKYNLYARLEDKFNFNLLQKAHKSGLKMVFWGVESANNRILKMINKGIEIETMKKVLKNSHKAGIYNVVFSLFGFPTETFDEAMDTLNFLVKNKKFIDYPMLNRYYLSISSKMEKEEKKYNIKKLENINNLNNKIEFCSKGMNAKEKQEIEQLFIDIITPNYKNSISFNLTLDEIFFILINNFSQHFFNIS